MKIMTYGKNIDVTPSLKEHAEEKVRKLDKYFNGEPMEVQISMEVERERHIVEVTAYVKGLILRGEEATGDMYASIGGGYLFKMEDGMTFKNPNFAYTAADVTPFKPRAYDMSYTAVPESGTLGTVRVYDYQGTNLL